MKKNEIVIGIGSFGCDLADYFNSQKFTARYFYFCDQRDLANFKDGKNCFTHFDHQNIDWESGAIMSEIFQDGNRHLLSINCECESDFQASMAIINELEKRKSRYHTIIIYPFYSAGNKKLGWLRGIEKPAGDSLSVYKVNREIFSKFGHMKFNEAFDAIYSDIFDDYTSM